MLAGISKRAQLGDGPIDSTALRLAVDYVRLNHQMSRWRIRSAIAILGRKAARETGIVEKIPRERIYALTGIQHFRFNTL